MSYEVIFLAERESWGIFYLESLANNLFVPVLSVVLWKLSLEIAVSSGIPTLPRTAEFLLILLPLFW